MGADVKLLWNHNKNTCEEVLRESIVGQLFLMSGLLYEANCYASTTNGSLNVVRKSERGPLEGIGVDIGRYAAPLYHRKSILKDDQAEDNCTIASTHWTL